MNITGISGNKIITNPLRHLYIPGISNNIIIKSPIDIIKIPGVSNNIKIEAHIKKIIISEQYIGSSNGKYDH